MYYLGVDLGGTNIAIGLVDEKLNIVFKDKVPTGASRPASDIMDDMAALCKKVVERAGATFDEVEYVGTCLEIINEPAYSYDCLLKFGDYVTYCDVRYICLWEE